MANILQDWQPRPSPSAVASTTASSRSLPLGSSTTSDQRSDYLSTHGYELDASSMGQDQWATLAAALSMAPVDDPATNPDIAKVAHKIRKRRTLTDKHMSELLTTIVASVAHHHPRLSVATQASFNRDAVPLDVPKFGIDSHWKIRLPTPKPAIAVGYNPSVFSSHQRELQQGIISDPTGEPRDLSRISQTTPGLYWPFFIIEIDGDSMIAARNASAGATATCNNALLMLAGAVVDHQNPEHDEEFINRLSRAIHSFSLAVSGKTACLMTHNSEGCQAEAVGIVRSYDLDQEKDVEALAQRMKSIFLWGQKARLQTITDLLEHFDRRVGFRESLMAQETVYKLPIEVAEPGIAEPKKKKSVFKAVLAESMPSWSRVEV